MQYIHPCAQLWNINNIYYIQKWYVTKFICINFLEFDNCVGHPGSLTSGHWAFMWPVGQRRSLKNAKLLSAHLTNPCIYFVCTFFIQVILLPSSATRVMTWLQNDERILPSQSNVSLEKGYRCYGNINLASLRFMKSVITASFVVASKEAQMGCLVPDAALLQPKKALNVWLEIIVMVHCNFLWSST